MIQFPCHEADDLRLEPAKTMTLASVHLPYAHIEESLTVPHAFGIGPALLAGESATCGKLVDFVNANTRTERSRFLPERKKKLA